jgi:metallo-beta-lactamase family protein
VAEPLYNVEQARKVFPHFKVINTDEVVPLDAEISAIFCKWTYHRDAVLS